MSEQKKSRQLGSFGFIVFLVCVITILISVTWLKLSIRRASVLGPANVCINYLRQIDAAAQQFALEHGKTNGEAINFPNDLTPYIKLNSAGKIPPCPDGGIYSLKKVGDKPICSLGTTVTPAHALP